MKPTTPHNNMSRMKKSEDTPVDAPCSHSPACPQETGFNLPVALPSSQQSKGYTFVNFGGYCTKANITNSAELRNIMIKLSKLVSDHGGNAISYTKSGTEMRFYFLRLEDRIYAAGKRGHGSPATSFDASFALPGSR